MNTPASAPAGHKDQVSTGAVQINSVTFYDSAGQRTTMFATGDEVRAEVAFTVYEPVEDVVVDVYFYSVFHNMHSHFSTDSETAKLNLSKGKGIVEFICPELPFEPVSFNIEACVRRRKSNFTEHLDYKHAASIFVRKGKPVHGVFHTPHTWSLKTQDERSDLADAVVSVTNEG